MFTTDQIKGQGKIENMIGQRSKRELAETICARYMKASKKDVTRIIYEFISVSGYPRNYALKLIKCGLR